MKARVVPIILLFLSSVLSAGEFPGKVRKWHGFDLHEFRQGPSGCKVVIPNDPAEGNPWIWRARFWGHEPQTDKALLDRGWHVVYCDVGNLFGNWEAVSRWDRFYKFLVEKHDFSSKVALEGMSRGGLIVYNWAAANPEKVLCIYADAPVCAIRSWPGGKGTGKGSPPTWQRCLKAFGLTEETSLDFKGNPIDNLAPLAKADIPLLHVVGQADTVVPVEENTDIIEKRYKALGGRIQVIRKEGVGHHPHSLKDPEPIVKFILEAASR